MSRPSGTGRRHGNRYLLPPLAALYGAVAAQRLQRKGFDAGVPVFCVGNYHVGGAGKTPAVLALAEHPARTRRDAGGAEPRLWRQLRGPVMVDPARHTAEKVGDEPLMMASRVPVVVARDRVNGRGDGEIAARQRHPDG